MVWSIVAVVLLVVGFGCLGGALFLWSSNRNILSGILTIIGGGLTLYVAPAAVPEVLPPGDAWEILASVTSFLGDWRELIMSSLIILLIIDGVLYAVHGIRANHFGLPHWDATAGTQWHGVLFCFISAIVLTVIVSIDLYNQHVAVKADSKFFELQEVIQQTEGIDVILEPGKPVAVTQMGSSLSPEESERLKKVLEERFKLNEKEDLIVDEIDFVQSRSNDGETIHDILIGFSGKIDKADPDEDVELTTQKYSIELKLDEDNTDVWLTTMIEGYKKTTLVLPSSPAPKKSAAKSGPSSKTVIMPPMPSRLSDYE